MMRFVIDASTALSWCFPDEGAALPADEAVAVVPALWLLEVANGLLVGERRGRITRAQSTRLAECLLSVLEVQVDDAGDAFKGILPLAREYDLSVYDAAYLELAIRLGLPLATGDGKLAAAAERCGVDIWR
jgi:predicted nucleic acid-binding protein